MEIIRVDGLEKTFQVTRPRGRGLLNLAADLVRPQAETVRALCGVSFTVRAGECVGYLGPNGAGKSTTIKCLTGILQPTAGAVDVLGWIPWRNRLQYTRCIGVVFGQKPLLLWDLPVRDTLRLYQAVYEVPDADFRTRVKEFDEVLSVGRLLDRPARKLSLGERMRCELAVALLHNPQVLFLDEPTVGLDVVAKENLRRFLRHHIEIHGTTVVLTTHQTDDVEALCSRIVIINRGQVLYDGNLEQFREQHTPSKRLHVRFGRVHDRARLAACLEAAAAREVGEDHLEAELDSRLVARVVAEVSAAVEARDIRIEEPRLESLISRWYSV